MIWYIVSRTQSVGTVAPSSSSTSTSAWNTGASTFSSDDFDTGLYESWISLRSDPNSLKMLAKPFSVRSLMIETARCVFPTPAGPMNMRPRSTAGYSRASLWAWSSASSCDVPGSLMKFANEHFAYRGGMRAAVINLRARLIRRQGQATAPFTGSTFVPVPKQSLQTSVSSVWRSLSSSITLITLVVPECTW